MTKYLLFFGSLSVLCGLVYVVDVQSSVDSHWEPARQYRRSIYSPGIVEGASPTVDLRPQTSGPIRVFVQEGAMVKRGDILLETQEPLRAHELALAESEVRLAQAQLDRLRNGAHPQEREEAAALYQIAETERDWAARLWRRTEELEKSLALSQEEADTRRTQWKSLESKAAAARARAELLISPPREEDVRMAEARVAAAEARLRLATEQLNRNRLHASCSGIVLKVNVEDGEEAGPQDPEAAIVLADTSRLRVRAFIEEIDAPRIALGMLAAVTADGLPNHVWEGRVSQVSPVMSRKQMWSDEPGERFETKVREIWIDLDEASGLIVHLRVDVMLTTSEGDSVDSDAGSDPTSNGGSPRNHKLGL